MKLHWSPALLAVALLTACATGSEPPTTPTTPTESDAAGAPTVQGEVVFAADVEIPDDGVLVLRIIPADAMDDPEAAIGAARLPVTNASGMPFELPYEAERYRPQTSYRLQAAVHADSRLLFYNGEGQPVLENGDAPVRLELVRP